MDTCDSVPIEQDKGPSPYTTEEIHKVAAFARQRGLKLFPVSASDGGKKPCCKGWLNEATSEPGKLFEAHLGRAGRFGLPCKSNGLIVIDCDVKDAETRGNGVGQFQEYCEKYGLPLSPVWQSTPSGGRHYFYRADFPETIRGRTKITLDGIPVNIDIRSPGTPDGDGNYIVSDLPGRSGYEWHGDWSQIPALPRRLVEELKEKLRQDAPEEWEGVIGGEVPARIGRIVKKRLAEIAEAHGGERNDTVFKLSCKIRRWLIPFPGEWEKWEQRILEAALKTGLTPGEAQKAIEQGRKGGEASGPYARERYQDEDETLEPHEAKTQQNGENRGGFAELPREAFSDRLWEFLDAIADKCSTSREISVANLLALGSVCLGYNCSIRISEQKRQHSNLWIVAISVPSSGKTFCFNIVTERLREIEAQMFAEREKEVKEWESWQNLSKAQKKERTDKGEIEPRYPGATGLIIKDSTPEAMFEVFARKPNCLLKNYDEMKSHKGEDKRYQNNNIGSVNSDALLSMYDSSPISIWRKTKDNQNHQIVIDRATLTLFGNIQPGLETDLFDKEDIMQGWPQRCIFIYATEPDPQRYPPRERTSTLQVEDEIRRITDRLWAAGQTERLTTIDKECERYLTPYFDSLAFDFMEPPLSKLRSFARRFYWTSFRVIHVLFWLEWALSPEKEVPKNLPPMAAYRGVILCRWLLTNAVSLFMEGQRKDDTGEPLQKAIAKIVANHEKDIIAEEYKVPSSTFREWLGEAGFGGHADQYFTKTLNAMKIVAGKARKSQNGTSASVCVKTFSDETLELCRKLARPAPLLFGRLDELEPPSEPQAGTDPTGSAVPIVTADPAHPAQPEPVTEAQTDTPPETLPETPPATIIEIVQPEAGAETPLPAADYTNPHGFAPLHLHTDASFQDAILTVGEAVEQAKKCNMSSLAITDHGNLHNARKFYQTARASGIHPVLGCEIYLKNDGLFPPPPDGQKARSSFHLTLLAENREGWKNLLLLQKHSYDNLHYNMPLVSHDFLASHSRGLIGMSACLGGEIAQAILLGHDPKPLLDWYLKVFGENSFFLERMENGYPDLKTVNPGLYALSQKCGVPVVATSDVHYLAPEDRDAYLVNSTRDWQLKNGESVAERGREPWSLHFRTAEEMRAAHGDRLEELELAGKIAARCDVELPEPEKDTHFMPSGEAIAGAEREAGEVLKEKALAGLSALGLEDRPEYAERLEHELEIITRKGFGTYILMIADMVDEARRKGIAVGPGRGSGAGSLVCYALGITRLDPIRHGLLFERFINPDRMSLPDIDVDYDEERRGEILGYLRAKYGEECVAAIGTMGTRKGKTAINDAVRNLQNDRASGMSKSDWTALGKKLSACVPEQCDKTIAELEASGAFARAESPAASRILKIAARLEGVSRQAGQHACGYVVSPHPLDAAMPLRCTVKGGPTVTQWTKDEVEAAGYVKLDALGSRTLTRIRKAEEKIRAAGKPEPSYSPDDGKTFDLFKSGELAGVFQMTGEGMRKLVMQVKPRSLDDITVAIALYRPGPLNSGMVEHFLKRRNGKEDVSYFGLDDMLRPILEETSGVIVYQEQVMRIAQAVAGFAPAEADVLRAAMGKKKLDIMSEKKGQFMAGAMRNGVSEEKASELFGMMEKFAEYGFNKAHAAAYALVSWQTAYLKANYPAEFLAACCETTDDNLSARSIAAECARLGIEKTDLPTKGDLPGFGEHPLKAYGNKGEGMSNVADLARGQNVTIRAYAENVRETTITKGSSAGQKMGMGKVSDETGILPFVAFSEAWGSKRLKRASATA